MGIFSRMKPILDNEAPRGNESTSRAPDDWSGLRLRLTRMTTLEETLGSAEQMLDTALSHPSLDGSRKLLQAATALRDTAARSAANTGMSPAARAELMKRLEAFDRRRFDAAKRLVSGADTQA